MIELQHLTSIEAEQAVLGSILLEPGRLDECPNQPEEFSDGRHQKIMEYMRYLNDIGKPVDILVMAEQAGKDISKVGGLTYLMQLRESVPSAANMAHYQSIVRELYVQRRTAETLREHAIAGSQIGVDAKETLHKAREALDEIAAMSEPTTGGFRKMSEVLDGHEKEIIRRRNQQGVTGAKTASKELNELTSGHQRGDLEIIAARPSMGKTAYVVNDMIATARGGRPAALFSIEMPDKQISERAACAIGNVDSGKLRTGQFSDSDWERWTYATEELERLPIFISDAAGITLQEIDSEVKRLVKVYPGIVIYVDFLQLVNPGRKFTKPNEGVSYVSKGLKQVARKHNVPVVAISAVGRDCEKRQDKRPMMSDLRESGSIESDADIVLFLYRDEYYDPNTSKPGIVELILAKGRNVGTGIVEMVFNKRTGRFLDIDHTKKEGGEHKRKANPERR
ncbi:replicative DNA helicase [Paenibacillus sp. J31TS4]|uniref:replicative DNA helicase n=1 Tax=Paenibacillus sp. J31TS4 TaxID=2807195 RepID=UPI001B06AB6E|nr:replicative DNA helicase [Paenibacillus sp. J31TS4]GIP38598.1 replicative DNA helicase [Paenibacillus sp. J31TS4]